MLATAPRRLVVEQQVDERLHRNSSDQALLVAEPLADETSEALETRARFSAQPRPSVAQYRVGVTERQERFTWHVAPAITVARLDEVVERSLQASEPAAYGVRGGVGCSKERLACKSCRAE